MKRSEQGAEYSRFWRTILISNTYWELDMPDTALNMCLLLLTHILLPQTLWGTYYNCQPRGDFYFPIMFAMISIIPSALLQHGLANLPTPPCTQRWSLVLCLMNVRLPSLGLKNLDISSWVSKRLSRNTPLSKLSCYAMRCPRYMERL